MICKNCGFDIPENDRFCTNCGAEKKAEAPVSESEEKNNISYTENNQTDMGNGYYYSNQNGFYSNSQNNGGYYAGNPAGDQQAYWAPPVNDKAATLKDYLKWMLLFPLLNFIPGIGFIAYIILCFKYALDSSFTARSNYFKAMLIAQAIGLVIAIFAVIAMFAVTAVGFSFLEDFDPSYFAHEFHEEIYDFLSVTLLK